MPFPLGGPFGGPFSEPFGDSGRFPLWRPFLLFPIQGTGGDPSGGALRGARTPSTQGMTPTPSHPGQELTPGRADHGLGLLVLAVHQTHRHCHFPRNRCSLTACLPGKDCVPAPVEFYRDRGGDRGSRWPWRRLGDRLRLVDRSSAGRRPVDLLRLLWGSPRRPFLSFSDLCSFWGSAFFFFSFFSVLSFGGGGGGSRGPVRGTSAARASRGGGGGRCDPSVRCFRSGAAEAAGGAGRTCLGSSSCSDSSSSRYS